MINDVLGTRRARICGVWPLDGLVIVEILSEETGLPVPLPYKKFEAEIETGEWKIVSGHYYIDESACEALWDGKSISTEGG